METTTTQQAPQEQEILKQLTGFNGSENFYKDGFNKCVYTDGYKAFMGITKSNWLFSDMAIYCMMKLRNKEDFIVATLKKDKNNSCEVTLDNGNGVILYKQKYAYTDFPINEFKFYIVFNECDSYTFMLTSEY